MGYNSTYKQILDDIASSKTLSKDASLKLDKMVENIIKLLAREINVKDMEVTSQDIKEAMKNTFGDELYRYATTRGNRAMMDLRKGDDSISKLKQYSLFATKKIKEEFIKNVSGGIKQNLKEEIIKGIPLHKRSRRNSIKKISSPLRNQIKQGFILKKLKSCNSKSQKARDSKYYCNPHTGRWNLKKLKSNGKMRFGAKQTVSMDNNTLVFLGAVIEYLLAEILDLCGSTDKKYIDTDIIIRAINADPDLKKLNII